jgi:DsbC/DsbD-like thiol-disulfide interchange protein
MVSVEVIPLVQQISPGDTFEIAVVFSMETDWHIYWQNPGDAGMPTSFEWHLPVNFKVMQQREPTPTRHMDEGITTFIHEEEAIYLFSVQAPDEVADSNKFMVDITWLECRELCQPGASRHHFELAGGDSPAPEKEAWTRLVERAELRFPKPISDLEGRLVHKGDHVEFSLKRFPRNTKLLDADFFPFAEMIYDTRTPVQIRRGLFRDKILIPLEADLITPPESLHGVLVVTGTSPGGPITTSSIINIQLP